MRTKTHLIVAAATSSIIAAFSQVSRAQQVNYSGGTYTQNFDVLPASGFTAQPIPNKTTPFDLTQPFPTGVGAGAAMTGWYAAHFIGVGTGVNPMQFYTTDGSDIQASIGGLGRF